MWISWLRMKINTFKKNTAFKQYNLMQKLSYKTNLGFEHGLNLQFSTSTDIPRYDRLTETDPSHAVLWSARASIGNLFFE
jgi:hypothetical protein